MTEKITDKTRYLRVEENNLNKFITENQQDFKEAI